MLESVSIAPPAESDGVALGAVGSTVKFAFEAAEETDVLELASDVVGRRCSAELSVGAAVAAVALTGADEVADVDAGMVSDISADVALDIAGDVASGTAADTARVGVSIVALWHPGGSSDLSVQSGKIQQILGEISMN